MTGQGVLSVLPVPVICTDAGGLVSEMNPAAAQLFGERAEGRAFVTLLRQAAVNAALDSVLAGGAAPRVQRVMLSPQGRDMTADIHIDRVGDGAVVTIIDQTPLERAEAMRRDFVANVSHELRTPLTALMGFIETLRGPARDDAAARDRFLEIMERESSRMNRLVADLLSLSRVESEERRRPADPVDLAGLARGAVQAMRPTAESAGVALRLGQTDLAAPVLGDADQLTQVLQNLIENAIKYGGSGGEVSLEMEHIAHEPVLRGPAIRVIVADRGEGIDPMHLPRLTERFYRVDTHRSREQGGTGLGLAIVKHIVNRHRGRLRVESQPGQGSRFSVILPLESDPEAQM